MKSGCLSPCQPTASRVRRAIALSPPLKLEMGAIPLRSISSNCRRSTANGRLTSCVILTVDIVLHHVIEILRNTVHGVSGGTPKGRRLP